MSKWLRLVCADRSLREAFFVFALSRCLILAIFVVAAAATLDTTSARYDPEDPHPAASLRIATVKAQLEHTLGRGDSGWYTQIARHGYDRAPFEAQQPHNWVFFPLYPFLLRAAGAVTGNYLIAGALISNAFFFIALVLLHKLVAALGYDSPTADRALFYTAMFPVSYFFSLPFTEALFLCLNVAAFFAAARDRWCAAGVFGGFASATRLAGVVLVPALALFRSGNAGAIREWRRLLCLALIPCGLLAFILFLWRTTGDPLAFVHAQTTWRRSGGFFLLTLYDYIRHPLNVIEPWNFRLLNFAAAVLALATAFFWARRRCWPFAIFTFLAIVLPLSSMTLQATTRYVAVIFPVFIALAIWGRNPRIDQLVRVAFLVLLGVMTLSYALRFSFASA